MNTLISEATKALLREVAKAALIAAATTVVTKVVERLMPDPGEK